MPMTYAHVRSFAIGALALSAIVGLSAFAAVTNRASAATSVEAGDLIRATATSAVYYYGSDGFRYVFPNEKTYTTWYSDANGAPDFSDVKWLTDAELGAIQIGGNVTYKAAVKMIKINTDPRVYFVTDGGVIRPVADEATATLMYGSTWNTKIDDVPDGFFGNYTVSDDEITSDDADIASWMNDGWAESINEDKGLVAPEEIVIDSDGYTPLDVTIEAGQTVRFTNNDSDRHTATADDGSWGSGTILSGGSYVQRFEEAGTFTFYDSYDNSNTGAIYVE